MLFFPVFDRYFCLCHEVQIFVKKSWKLNIIKCIYHIFQELFTEINYLNYFKSYIVIECYKREKTYCKRPKKELNIQSRSLPQWRNRLLKKETFLF